MKIFETCPDIDTGGPRCILFEAEDDDENFYVDLYCYYEDGPSREPTREEVIAECGPIDHIPPEKREGYYALVAERMAHDNIKMCSCTRRLTPKELVEFPYYFKDIQLSEKGWERLHKAYEEFGDDLPSDADDSSEV